MPQMGLKEPPMTPVIKKESISAFDPPGFMPFADEKAYRVSSVLSQVPIIILIEGPVALFFNVYQENSSSRIIT